ncbi:MAG: efflux RND transporter periplasmic adaptor subunit [Vicingaceae bacterium]
MIKRILKYLLAFLFVALLIYTFYYLYQKNQEPDVVFETSKVSYKDIVKQTVATGSVLPRQEIEIKPQVSGIVDKIYVQEGDIVKIGDLIAKVKVIPDMLTLSNAENRLTRAEFGFENAELGFKRSKKLFDDEVIAIAEFQDAELAFKNAKQELEAAKENLQIVRDGMSVRSGELSNTLIRSTKAGTVLDVPIEEGNSVIETNNFNDGTTIATIADLSDMVFEGKVDESEVGKIQTGMAILLRIGAIADEVYDAKLEYISPKGIEDNGAIQFEIKAALELKEGKFIRAGYSANAEIVLDRRDSVLAVKESLLTFHGDSAFVEVEEGNQQFKLQYVELGLSDGIYAELLSPLDTASRLKIPNFKIERGE